MSMIRLSCCTMLVVLATLWWSWNLGIQNTLVSSITQQLHVLVEEVIRRAQDEHKEVEHPHTLRLGNHVEAVARAGPRRGDARNTGMLYIIYIRRQRKSARETAHETDEHAS